MARFSLISLLCALALAFPGLAAAESPPVSAFIYARPDSDIDIHNSFVWEVLRAALQRTESRYGAFIVEPTATTLSAPRRRHMLESGEGPVTVAVIPAGMDITRLLLPVRIPISRGLLGYRLLLIHGADQPRFDAIQTLEQMRTVSIGSANYWPDTVILRQAGLLVVPGDSYEHLFEMLRAHRFDAFSRGGSEITEEFAKYHPEIPDLIIERSLVLHYPFADYFWFGTDLAGRLRQQRVAEGLSEMVADGTSERMFMARYGEELKRFDLGHRRVIEIPNPLLTAADHLDDARLWFRPGQ